MTGPKFKGTGNGRNTGHPSQAMRDRDARRKEEERLQRDEEHTRDLFSTKPKQSWREYLLGALPFGERGKRSLQALPLYSQPQSQPLHDDSPGMAHCAPKTSFLRSVTSVANAFSSASETTDGNPCDYPRNIRSFLKNLKGNKGYIDVLEAQLATDLSALKDNIPAEDYERLQQWRELSPGEYTPDNFSFDSIFVLLDGVKNDTASLCKGHVKNERVTILLRRLDKAVDNIMKLLKTCEEANFIAFKLQNPNATLASLQWESSMESCVGDRPALSWTEVAARAFVGVSTDFSGATASPTTLVPQVAVNG